MIRVRLSAALAVRDGFTGKPMAQNAVGCILDGQVCHPGYRPGGYLIFTNLAPDPIRWYCGAGGIGMRRSYWRSRKPAMWSETSH